jgi:uncharacterized membrane protein YgaE (UPF0421/DUF939 family)
MPIQWNDVKKWVSDTTNTAVQESKELARKGKIQVDIMSLRHQTTVALTELGSTVYELIRKEKTAGVEGNDKVKELVEKIHDLELELKRKDKEKKTKKYT